MSVATINLPNLYTVNCQSESYHSRLVDEKFSLSTYFTWTESQSERAEVRGYVEREC